MSASLAAREAIDLVGPKGYEHGWKYVGGPGLPSAAERNVDRPRAGEVRKGDKLAATFHPGKRLSTHEVTSVSHTGAGKNRRTHMVLRDTRTGETHKQSLRSSDRLTGRIAKGPDSRSRPTPQENRRATVSRYKDMPFSRGNAYQAARRQGRSHKEARNYAETGSYEGRAPVEQKPLTGRQRIARDQLVSQGLGRRAAENRVRRSSYLAAANEGNTVTALDFAAPENGDRLRKLSAALAARGARNPEALAAYISRRGYAGDGTASQPQGQQLANDDLGIYLATDFQGMTLTCPQCGHSGPAGMFGTEGTAPDRQPAALDTQRPNTAQARAGAPLAVRGGKAAHALASPARAALELAAGARHPVSGPLDVLVSRAEDGTARLRHRNGGAEIARLRRNNDGTWTPTVNGTDLQPRAHQRMALLDAVGTWNKAVTGNRAPADQPLLPAPQQSALMAEYGIPATRSAALATPTAGASDGPRVTTAAGDAGAASGDGSGPSGLSPKALAIYKKLIARGFPPARARSFAQNSDRFAKKAAA